MAKLQNLTVTQTDDPFRVTVSLDEDGTHRVFSMTHTDAEDFVRTVSHRHGIAVQYIDRNGRGTAVSIPDDVSYVSPDAVVYLVQHPSYETYGAAFSRRDADRMRADEVRDAIEADASMARDYYVTETSVSALEVPHEVRLCGRSAVLEYLHGG